MSRNQKVPSILQSSLTRGFPQLERVSAENTAFRSEFLPLLLATAFSACTCFCKSFCAAPRVHEFRGQGYCTSLTPLTDGAHLSQ